MKANPVTQTESGGALISEAEVAAIIGMSRSYLRQARVRGEGLPFVKIGRAVRYRLNDVQSFIVARMKRSTSDSMPHTNRLPPKPESPGTASPDVRRARLRGRRA